MNKSSNPWRQIDKFLPNYVDDVRRARSNSVTSGHGLTRFLSSDPNVLFKRLEVLLAEKKAGNNNVMNEASEIADELRRQGVLSISKLKKIFKQFK